MDGFNGWRQRFRKHLEGNLKSPSREVNEGQWVFDPAIVTVSGDAAAIFVQVTRAFESERPELTSQRQEWSFTATDDVEVAALEVARFVRTVQQGRA